MNNYNKNFWFWTIEVEVYTFLFCFYFYSSFYSLFLFQFYSSFYSEYYLYLLYKKIKKETDTELRVKMIKNIITLKFRNRYRCYCLKLILFKSQNYIRDSSFFFLSITLSIHLIYFYLPCFHTSLPSFAFHLTPYFSLFTSWLTMCDNLLIDIWNLKCVHFSNECITYYIITFTSTFESFKNKVMSCNRFSNNIN